MMLYCRVPKYPPPLLPPGKQMSHPKFSFNFFQKQSNLVKSQIIYCRKTTNLLKFWFLRNCKHSCYRQMLPILPQSIHMHACCWFSSSIRLQGGTSIEYHGVEVHQKMNHMHQEVHMHEVVRKLKISDNDQGNAVGRGHGQLLQQLGHGRNWSAYKYYQR